MSTFHTDNDLGINLHTCLDDGISAIYHFFLPDNLTESYFYLWSAGNSAGVVLYAHTQKRKMCKAEGLQETRRPIMYPFLGQS